MMKTTFALRIITCIVLSISMLACSSFDKAGNTQKTDVLSISTGNESNSSRYSSFGAYQALPDWSGWCGNTSDASDCTQTISSAVSQPGPTSRPVVRAHGWRLWAAINSPLSGSNYELASRTSNLIGTTGCWSQSSSGAPACSGRFPIWLSWPNTGLPYNASQPKSISSEHIKPAGGLNTHRRVTARSAADSESSQTLASALAKIITLDPDPTIVHTVNTIDTLPAYHLPALTLVKQCGLEQSRAEKLINAAYSAKTKADKKAAWDTVAAACSNGIVCADDKGICDGSVFVNQGDIMIATESLTTQAWNSIQKNKIYHGSDTLTKLYNEGNKDKAANQVASWLDHGFISTKHMYWPVKGCKPGVAVGKKGCRVRYGALPPWVPAKFKHINYATNADYLGYEKWGKVVAIDTCGERCPATKSATLVLENVKGVSAITNNMPDVYNVDRFEHIQISEEVLNKVFSATDRALLDQASLWAYGSDANGFEAGDFLVVVAMHITTKEIPSWTFQSVWWSPMNDKLEDCPLADYRNCYGQSAAYSAGSKFSGLDTSSITSIDKRVGKTWRNNYLLADSYGIAYEIDGKPAHANNYFSAKPPLWATQRPTGENVGMLPVAMNVYIEPVIHPLGTNCQNCHRRAGAVNNSPGKGEYAGGVGRSNYQNAQCPSLLADYGMPDKDPCMMTPWAWNKSKTWNAPVNNQCKLNSKGVTGCSDNEAFPIANTDLSWFISDGHVQKASSE